MDYGAWEPVYQRIIDDFGFSREKDEESARILSALAQEREICRPSCLSRIISEEVTVCGYAPRLEMNLERVAPTGTVIAADGATKVLMERGIVPDIIVTDLDGNVESQVEANSRGSVLVVLAHGDNIPSIQKYVPRFQGAIVPTTQSKPFEGMYNFGGFTDGDRAVELARHFGAKHIVLLGFDFLNPREQQNKDNRIKQKKLEWARKIIFDLNPPDVSLWSP